MNEQAIPKKVQRRLKNWFYAFNFFIFGYYIVGVGGVLASAISAGYHKPSSGVISACCIAVLAFVKTEERYRKYVVAWRFLDRKVNQYRHNLITIVELLKGMKDAERKLDKMETDAKR